MSFKLALLDYKQLISLPDGSYKGITETSDGWVVQDLHKGTNFGVYGSLDKAVIMAHAYSLNLLQPVPESTPTDSPLVALIKHPKLSHKSRPSPAPVGLLCGAPRVLTTDTPDNSAAMPFETYCSLLENPKNKSGYKFIVDKSGSLGWVILKEGTSEYGRYASVQEALEEAYKHNLNLKTKKELK
jgi:hypothetical protein